MKPEKDGTLVNCQAGCKYIEIEAATAGEVITQVGSAITIRTVREGSKDPAGAWWEKYTGVPWDEWESWGTLETKDGVAFCWSSSPVKKVRKTGTKAFEWIPAKATAPPLWPQVPDKLPSRVWLAEGESDVGILRHLGFEAFGITKGAHTRLPYSVWRTLRDRGATEIILCFDADEAGVEAAYNLRMEITQANLQPIIVDLAPGLDPLMGEKDLRDLWLRLRDRDKVKSDLRRLVESGIRESPDQRSDLFDFLSTPIGSRQWLTDRIWLRETTGMIVGPPKLGKSWLALDLGISLTTGTPFLGTFDIPMVGPVVYIAKEDPDYLLHDRITKILGAKGLGGHVQRDGNIIKIFNPGIDARPPMFLDMSRSFYFDLGPADRLMFWLDDIKEEYGEVSMVIFDPILRMIAGVDEFKASDVSSSIFRVTEKIQQETGAACTLIHHTPKSGGGAYGSVAFRAFSENSHYLLGDKPGRDGWVEVETEFKSEAAGKWAFHFVELDKEYVVEAVRPR